MAALLAHDWGALFSVCRRVTSLDACQAAGRRLWSPRYLPRGVSYLYRDRDECRDSSLLLRPKATGKVGWSVGVNGEATSRSEAEAASSAKNIDADCPFAGISIRVLFQADFARESIVLLLQACRHNSTWPSSGFA